MGADEALEPAFEGQLGDGLRLAFRVAFAVLRNRADAEDVAQEACLRAYRHRDQLRAPASLRSWLVRVAWRLAIDSIRAVGRRERRELAAVPEASVEELAASDGSPRST